MTSLEMDHLRDPHSLMDAYQVEQFLSSMQKHYSSYFMDKDFITSVGHHCFYLKCWGGLDDFLKIFKSPRELHLKKLNVFFSYFINPMFEIRDEEESKSSYCFYTNFNTAKFPMTHLYFKAVLESLPLFMGESLTEVKWENGKVEIFYPHEKNLTLPLDDFKSKNSNPDYLLDQLRQCEQNIIKFKKQKKVQLLDKVLMNLNDIKMEYRKNRFKK